MSSSGRPAPLDRYRSFRAAAATLLKEDGDHSVWSQVVNLFWSDTAFRVINEARKSASAARPNAAIAPLLGEFVDQAYVAGEIIAIGRLTDPPGNGTSRGVISLPTVLRLVRDNRDSITRENFVTFDGAPYDYESSKAASRTVSTPGVRWVAREPWDDAEDRHELFDRLSRKVPANRKPSDLIHRAVLAACEKRLQSPAILKFRRFRNKVISHAADAASRNGLEGLGLSLADVDEAHRAILEVAEVLSTLALGSILVGGPVAIPQDDVLRHLEEPFAFVEDLDRLQTWWATHTEEREQWSSQAVEAVIGR